jgi:hypothetical protein
MSGIIRLVGANKAVELFGVRMVGVSAENGKKFLFTLVFILFVTDSWADFAQTVLMVFAGTPVGASQVLDTAGHNGLPRGASHYGSRIYLV